MNKIKKVATKLKLGRPKALSPKQVEALADEMMQYFYDHTEIKHLSSFCAYKQTYAQKLTELANDSGYFAEALRIAKELLHSRIVEDGFDARSSNFHIFNLKCNYGYKDTQDVNVTSDSEITISYDTVSSHDDIDNEDD
jgi:hypothetical protein